MTALILALITNKNANNQIVKTEERLKRQVLEIIFKYISKDNCVIFLFGSLAQGKVYPSSDIDIGIVSAQPLNNSMLVKIKQELGGVKTLRDIDIVDFLSLQDKDFLKLALKEIKIWHQTKKSRAYLDSLNKLIQD